MPSVPKTSVNILPSINCCYKIIFCVSAVLSGATLGVEIGRFMRVGIAGAAALQEAELNNMDFVDMIIL